MPTCDFCNQRISSETKTCPKCGAHIFPADVARTADVASSATEGDVVSMLQQGRKIDAIRMYREQTGAGLREAKDAVESLEQGENRLAAVRAAGPAGARAYLKADLWALIQNNQPIQAIKFYRERTGCSLKQAKDAVDAVAREHGVVPKAAGCLGMVLFCLALSGVLLWLVA
jgi:ribosomal protein L7/L12